MKTIKLGIEDRIVIVGIIFGFAMVIAGVILAIICDIF